MPVHLPATARLGDRLIVFRAGESFVTRGSAPEHPEELTCATPDVAGGGLTGLRCAVEAFVPDRHPPPDAAPYRIDIAGVAALVHAGRFPSHVLLLCTFEGEGADLAALLRAAAGALDVARAARYGNVVLLAPPGARAGGRELDAGEVVEALGLLGAIVGVDVTGLPAGRQADAALAGLYGGAVVVRCDATADVPGGLARRLDPTRLGRGGYPPVLL